MNWKEALQVNSIETRFFTGDVQWSHFYFLLSGITDCTDFNAVIELLSLQVWSQWYKNLHFFYIFSNIVDVLRNIICDLRRLLWKAKEVNNYYVFINESD